MKADVELDAGGRNFGSGLLPELIALLRTSRPGDLISVLGDDDSLGHELEIWCRFTGNHLIESSVEMGRRRWIFRSGSIAEPSAEHRPVGSRLWLYTNFHCNLRCDYCCVRSSPTAPKRE